MDMIVIEFCVVSIFLLCGLKMATIWEGNTYVHEVRTISAFGGQGARHDWSWKSLDF